MGTDSIDLQTLDRGERRARLGGSSHAAGPSHEYTDSDEPTATGKQKGRLWGAMQQAATKNRADNGGGFPPQNDENDFQDLKFICSKKKRNGKKKSRNRNRRVTFAV
ncbi:uncharacterized protein LOC143210746 [Lasioglossum baleicum]|uniref:uncharacterized protein LOC143210746 n=1 Tax=Lasioglossum baleicum TaxID=434251 RepID=UPI003FCD926F